MIANQHAAPTLQLLGQPKLYRETDALLAQVEKDESLQPELAAQLANIYDALSDSGLRDYFGVIDAAINAHVALIDGMAQREWLLDSLLEEYETGRGMR